MDRFSFCLAPVTIHFRSRLVRPCSTSSLPLSSCRLFCFVLPNQTIIVGEFLWSWYVFEDQRIITKNRSNCMCLDLEGTWGNWLNISLLLNSIFSCHVFHNLHEAAKLKQKVVLVIFGTWEVWRINQLELLNFVAFDILIHQRCYWDIQRYLMVVSSGAYYFYPSVRPLLSSRCQRQKFDGITHVPVDSLEQVSKSWIPFTTEICGRLRTCAVRC